MITDHNQLLTKAGWCYPSELAQEAEVSFVDPQTGNPVLGQVCASVTPVELYGYSLCPREHTSGKINLSLICTRPQRVVLENGDFTLDMRVGDRVIAAISDVGYSEEWWGRGFLYGINELYLHTDIIIKYPQYRSKLYDLYVNNVIIGPPVIPYEGSPVEKGSFISGYLASSRWPSRFKTANSSLMDFFIENAGLAGITITGKRAVDLVTDAHSHKVVTIHTITYGRAINTKYFRVIEGPIKADKIETAYAVYLDNGGTYTVKGGWTLGSD